MAWLLDTNVLSELRKPKADQRVLDFVTSTPLEELYVGIVPLAEIRFGIDFNPEAQKSADLQEWLTLKVRPIFDPQRTLPVTELPDDIADAFGAAHYAGGDPAQK